MADDMFSKRFGYSRPQQAEIQIREDAPPFVREALVQIAYDVGLEPTQLRTLVCRLLRVRPDPSNWSAPNVRHEVDQLLDAADWYRIYDFVEAVYQDIMGGGREDLAARWQDEVNEFFLERGVGWQLVNGTLEVRGSESFEVVVRGGVEALSETGQSTASAELHEAIQDLSRRPDPDVTGAMMRELGKRLPLAIRGSSARRAVIPSNPAVGEVFEFRIRTGSCSAFRTIQAAVRVIGTKGIWLEDMDNPADHFSDAEVQSLSDVLDSHIYRTDVEYFGSPSDIDGNGRIVVVITKEANRIGTFGYVTTADLFPRTVCDASNEGEIYYAATPNPAGTVPGAAFPHSMLFNNTPPTIAHELTHIIQASRRIELNASSLMASWEAEGQAVLAEVINGWAVQGRGAGQNYGGVVAFNHNGATPIDWYSYPFRQLRLYYGFDGTSTKVNGAPEECSWLESSSSNDGPCIRGGLIYGPPWSLLQWLGDQFGPTFSGGVPGLQKALIANLANGYENVSSTVGIPIETLLAQWAAMLYTDDRAPGMAARLTLPSWNLFDVYDVSSSQAERLVPRSRAFASFTDAFSVRASSSAYFRVSGDGRPATAIRVRNSSDGNLPSIIQVFIVRLD